jgi:uncharacterized MAPEG superfamily protein
LDFIFSGYSKSVTISFILKDDTRLNEALILAFLYILGRVLFVVGYVLGGTFHMEVLRSPGFTIGIMIQYSLLA